MDKIRWGILSTGSIANSFVEDLKFVPDAEVIAVGSRKQAVADKFGDKHNIPNRYDSYHALANDPEVDVIYVATPHSMHAENSIMCMEAGKAVLCEKAFCITAGEAEKMIAVARREKVFLMEALVTRHFPVIHKVLEWINLGLIGEVRIVQANRCARGSFRPEQRHLNPELGGGSLLDVGIYVISFSSMIYQQTPKKVVGFGHVGEFGSDEQGATILEYENGALGVLTFALRTEAVNEAYIYGTKGHIKLPELFAVPTCARLHVKGEKEVVFNDKIKGNGLNYQVHEVHRCLREGLLESPRMPLHESLQIMQTMDKIRAPWSFRYPNDKK
ncbi:MAG: gfo/Idh/MocA family oxidoreductase [Calditrichaeota bacterium]|nr:MAG: gfo/Idh/MocA family oxidoreductase [Calditrichota bacterium]